VVQEWARNNGGTILTGQNRSTGRKICPVPLHHRSHMAWPYAVSDRWIGASAWHGPSAVSQCFGRPYMQFVKQELPHHFERLKLCSYFSNLLFHFLRNTELIDWAINWDYSLLQCGTVWFGTLP